MCARWNRRIGAVRTKYPQSMGSSYIQWGFPGYSLPGHVNALAMPHVNKVQLELIANALSTKVGCFSLSHRVPLSEPGKADIRIFLQQTLF